MPPRAAAVPTYQPPATWKLAYRRIAAFRQSLATPVPEETSSWRSATCDRETYRFHCLVSLMLSAMTRGATCEAVMDRLIKDGLTPERVQSMGEAQLRDRIKTISFCHRKTQFISETTDIILQKYQGNVPRSYDELIALPGVGPKMANLFFDVADHRTVGIGVDTHVYRISQRLGWVPPTVKSPEDTRKALEALLPRKLWLDVNFNLVTLGRHVCRSRNPKCEECCVRDICPSSRCT